MTFLCDDFYKGFKPLIVSTLAPWYASPSSIMYELSCMNYLQLKPIFIFHKIWWASVPFSSYNPHTFSNISLLSPTLFSLHSGTEFSLYYYYFFGAKRGTSTPISFLIPIKTPFPNIAFCTTFIPFSSFILYILPGRGQWVFIPFCI